MLDLNVGRVSDNGGEMPDDVLHFDLNILPGDVNRSGVVLADDFAAVRKRFFKNTASPVAGTDTDYSPFHDLNGSSAIHAPATLSK